MKYIYLLHYNNYANRTMKSENNVGDYLGSGDENLITTITNVNLWNPNDGIIGEVTTPTDTDFSVEPDYCITSTDGMTVDSRWFVTENVRIQKGQYRCTLKRDVFAEAWNDLIHATCNIDRAILNKYSPLVFNPEPISVNQINKSETLIKDKTGCPWIVFYGDSTNVHATATRAQSFDYATTDIDDWKDAWEAEYEGKYLMGGMFDTQMVVSYKSSAVSYMKSLKLLPYGIDDTGVIPETIWEYYRGNITYNSGGYLINYNHFMSKYSLKSQTKGLEAQDFDGKIVYDSVTDKYYTIHITSTPVSVRNGKIVSSDALYSDVQTILQNYTDCQTPSSVPASSVITLYNYTSISISVDEITSASSITVKVPAGSLRMTDSPYYGWCMPYGNITCTVDGTTVVTDAETNLMAAMALSKEQSSSAVWSFEILPWCPLPDGYINSDGSITVTSVPSISSDDTLVDSNNNPVGFVFCFPKSSFTRQILLDNPITSPDYKMSSLTEVYRLYSPNYASSFEFSVAKNAGLTGFNIRCTYLPINPYMRVTPIWGGLYGTNEEEVRGLVCGGDYSMARVNDSWVQYQENNKNYQAIFNRQIDNMDVMRKYERIEQVSGTALGALEGAAIGGKAFGPVGAVVGAVGAIGTGIADYNISEGKYKESKSYATDMHELQLGNIQAMPRTIARTTAFNIDNRYFPILTRYSCTSDEIKAVTEFIINRSMNVGIIGKPQDYIYNEWISPYDITKKSRGFIQGSIIHIDTSFDTHFVDSLNEEFRRGVYLR